MDLPDWDLPLTCYDDSVPPFEIDSGSRYSHYERRNPDFDDPQIFDDTQQWSQLRRTQLEISMIHIINAITDKPHWESKIHDPKIRQKWTEEIERQLSAADTRYAEESRELRNGPFYWGQSHDKKAASFIIDELLHKAQCHPGYTTVLGLEGADIVKSDTMVSEDFRQNLLGLVSRLEEEGPPDWHPGREGVVRDLVHPSMYPLEFGKTLFCTDRIPLEAVTSSVGQAETLRIPKPAHSYSTRFQWLPAEVRGNKDYVFLDSYINNLDTAHEELYSALGELVRLSLPMWEGCMATQGEDAPRRVPCEEEDSLWTADQSDAALRGATPPYVDRPKEHIGSRTEAREYLREQRRRKWHTYEWDTMRPKLIWPLPDDFVKWSSKMEERNVPSPVNLSSHLTHQGLQVIVKIASIHLSPEHPVFSGGAAHVEGLSNEHICATSIFYVSSTNIQVPQLAFTSPAHMGPMSYLQDDYRCLEHVYGTSLYETPATQLVGTVKTPQGRLITFPNVFQHQILPFELIDKTKTGEREMVVLWLVNPQKRIISTANVPPQQEWVYERALEGLIETQGSERHSREKDIAKATMTKEEANNARLELMAERGRMDDTGDMAVQRKYVFCEH